MGDKEEMARAMDKARNEKFLGRWLRVKKATPPQRLAKKIVKREMLLQDRRDAKREEKEQSMSFQSYKQGARAGGTAAAGGGGGVMDY